MKKTIFISIGGIIILLIVGVWAYLFMYGTPKSSDEVFARFGFGEEVPPPVIPEATTVDVSSETVVGAPQKLKQLTTRAVAGATFTGTGILYVEQGTGHLYHINLTSGGETLISGTTIPQAREAVFSDGGAYVAITSAAGMGERTIVGEVTLENGSGTLEGVALPEGATEVAFSETLGTMYYLLKESGGSSGYSYNIEREVGTKLFSIPLRDVDVLWGSPLYVYTTPTAAQTGYVYKVVKGALQYVAPGGMGLSAFQYEGGVVVTKSNKEIVYTGAISLGGDSHLQPMPLLTEKCTTLGTSTICAVPLYNPNPRYFPDEWYRGSVSFKDTLWKINLEEGSAFGLVDLLKESGREIDVVKIGADTKGERVWFVNKNDNTLWMFDTTL
jgi:hypothetical protein